jgi:hypothetical protein
MSQKSKTPSERDQKIYWQVRGNSRTQRDVAKEFNMTQPRVCQIVRDVAAHFAGTMPGLELCLSEAEQLRLMSRECVERRQRLILRAEEEYEASKRPLVTTIEKRMVNDEEWDQTIRRGQRGDVRLLKIVQQENDRLASWADKALTSGQGESLAGRPSSHGGSRIDVNSSITPTTSRGFESLDTRSPEYVFYPFRSEGEMSSCMLAQVVVDGGMTPAEYIQMLERQELEKPLVCPLALARAEESAERGTGSAEREPAAPSHSALCAPHSALPAWRVRERDELRLPSPLAQKLLDEGRHAQDLDATTQAELYQPCLSRAEYYATIRREMLGERMLSPDEFATLSAWASRLPGGLPAEGVDAEGRLINAERGTRSAEREASKALTNKALTSGQGESLADAPSSHDRPPSATSTPPSPRPLVGALEGQGESFAGVPSSSEGRRDPAERDIHAPITPTTGRGFERTTRERLLAAGKPLSARTRARWERKIERRRGRESLALG